MRNEIINADIKRLTAEIESLQQEIQQAETTGADPETLLAKHRDLIKQRYKLHQVSRCNSDLPEGIRHIGEILQEIQGAFLPGVI